MDFSKIFKSKEQNIAYCLGILSGFIICVPFLYAWTERFSLDYKNVEIREISDTLKSREKHIEHLNMLLEESRDNTETLKGFIQDYRDEITGLVLRNNRLYLGNIISSEDITPLGFRNVAVGSTLKKVQEEFPSLEKMDKNFYRLKINKLNDAQPFSTMFFYPNDDGLIISVLYIFKDQFEEAFEDVIQKNMPESQVQPATSLLNPTIIYGQNDSPCGTYARGNYQIFVTCVR